MDWLNYHHLLYFWTVVKEGTVSKAAEVLHLAQPTVSAQLRALERSLGQKLFQKRGRNLVLTTEGEVEDMAMLQTLGQHGHGLFVAPTVVQKEVCQRYGVRCLGQLDRVRERFYAISVERKLTHPAVLLIAEQARRRLFTDGSPTTPPTQSERR